MDQNSKKFKDLQSKWYAKLERSGFKDIEDKNHNIKWFSRSQVDQNMKPSRGAYNKAKQLYFRYVGYFLNEHEFASNVEKLIWELHSEGLSYTVTEKNLRKKRIKIARTQIKETIHRLRKIMLDKYKDYENE